MTGHQTARAFLTRQPILVELDERLPYSETQGLAFLYRHFQIRSAIIVPLLAGRNCIGCAGFAVTATQPYDEADVHTAMELGSRIAAANANARTFDYQRTTALTLQRALLPRDIPQVPNLDLVWRYLPGASGAEVGGDWFDVIPLPGGRVALVIGDVMGHGLQAAAAMGQLRATTRTLARLDLPPTHVLTELDDVALLLARSRGDTRAATGS